MSAGSSQEVQRHEAAVRQIIDAPHFQALAEPQSIVPRRRWYLPLKHAVEFLLSLLLLVLLSPIIALAAVAIKLSSPGPIFYSQTRLGKDHRPFKVLKLRTMIHNAEALTGPVWSSSTDSRVTWVGKLLRKTHIDEFPQLINILDGSMSLIGPRPERPEFVSKLDWQIPHYRDRLNVRPGITGLAQLRLPPDSHVMSVRAKLAHDLYYIHHMSPWLDLRIFFFTGWRFAQELLQLAWRVVALPQSTHVIEDIKRISAENTAENASASTVQDKPAVG